jgi:hypothetical protein
MVIAANAADAAGDEVRIAGIFPLHEDAVSPKDGRRAVAFGHFTVFKIDLGVNTQAAGAANYSSKL